MIPVHTLEMHLTYPYVNLSLKLNSKVNLFYIFNSFSYFFCTSFSFLKLNDLNYQEFFEKYTALKKLIRNSE